jgi:hypothetical protein
VQVGEIPFLGGGLSRVQRVVGRRRRTLRLVELHGFGPGDLLVMRELVGGSGRRPPVRNRHDEAVDADHRHRPTVDEGQLMVVRNIASQALARASREVSAIIAAIASVRPEMIGRMAHHHQDLALRSDRRRALRGGGRVQRERRRSCAHRQQAAGDLHDFAPSIGCARSTCRSARSRVRADWREAAGTRRR